MTSECIEIDFALTSLINSHKQLVNVVPDTWMNFMNFRALYFRWNFIFKPICFFELFICNVTITVLIKYVKRLLQEIVIGYKCFSVGCCCEELRTLDHSFAFYVHALENFLPVLFNFFLFFSKDLVEIGT